MTGTISRSVWVNLYKQLQREAGKVIPLFMPTFALKSALVFSSAREQVIFLFHNFAIDQNAFAARAVQPPLVRPSSHP